MSVDNDGESGVPSSHQFVTVPPVPQRTEDPTVASGRLVVALVVAIVVAIGAFAAAMGELFASQQSQSPPVTADLGPFNPLVSRNLPPEQLVIIAILALVMVAAFAVAFEVVAALMSISPRRKILSSYREPAGGMPADGAVRITILVPAHNEEFSLPVTLGALKQQTRDPDRVIVVADNCTDRTVEIAHEMGYETFESVDNVHKKGGALNQALAEILPDADARDVIMIMDADTRLSPRFLEVGGQRFADDRELTAVGGVF